MKEHGKSKEPRQVCTGIPYSSLRDSTHAHEALCELICAYCNDEEIGEQSSTEDEPSAVDLAFGIHYLLFRNSERLAVLVLILEGSPWDDSNFEQPSDAMEKLIKRRAAELDHDRHRFVEAVRWLCSNKSLSPAGRPSRTHVKTGGFRFGRHPFISPTDEKFVRYFEKHGLRHLRRYGSLRDGRFVVSPECIHAVDLLCAFLVSQADGKLPTELPIKICRRCRTFFVSRRSDTEFCPKGCQRENYWTKERHRDYQYVQSLERFAKNICRPNSGYSMADLQRKLGSVRVRERLHGIEERWKSEWPTIVERVRDLGKLAKDLSSE